MQFSLCYLSFPFKKKFSLLYSFFQFNFVTLFVKFFHLIFFPGMVSPCCLFPPTMKCFTLLLLPPIVTRCLLFHIEPHKLNLRRVFAYKVSFQAVLSFILSTFSNNLLFHFAQERKRPPLCFSTRWKVCPHLLLPFTLFTPFSFKVAFFSGDIFYDDGGKQVETCLFAFAVPPMDVDGGKQVESCLFAFPLSPMRAPLWYNEKGKDLFFLVSYFAACTLDY